MPHLKNGADWFKFDVAFFSGQNVRKLKLHCGANGVEAYLRLLCATYSTGYYILYDDDLVTTLAMDVGVKENFIRQVIGLLAKWSMVDATLLSEDKVITSKEIQLMYQEIVRGRAAKRLLRNSVLEVDGRYWLLAENETDSCIKVRPFSAVSETNPTLSETNPTLSDDNRDRVDKRRIEKNRVDDSTAMPGQNDDLSTEKSIVFSTSKSLPKIDAIQTANAVAELFKETLPSLPYTGVTERLIVEIGKAAKPVDYYRKVFERAAKSSWLCAPRPGASWCCSLEWLCKPVNAEKVLAGDYDDFVKPGKPQVAPERQGVTVVGGVESGFDTETMFEAALRRSWRTAEQDPEILERMLNND